MVKEIIAATILLIVIFYVFGGKNSNTDATKTIFKSIGDNFASVVKALQGRP